LIINHLIEYGAGNRGGNMTPPTQHAIVLGGSITGLLAARVLSDHFGQVTVIERDALPSAPVARKGVPQSRHLHGFLAGGVNALAGLFPGFVVGAVARGARHVDVGRMGTWYIGGVAFVNFDARLHGLLMSRLALEAYVRELVRTRTNVTFSERTRACGLVGSRERVEGVRVSQVEQAEAAGETCLHADLVIDASGRGSRATHWLAELGVAQPSEETVRADITTSTCTIRRRPEHLGGAHAFIYSPTPPGLTSGAALAIEDDRYIVAMTSYLDAPAPRTYDEMVSFARALPVRGLDSLLESAEPLSEVVQFHERESRRRRFERMRSFPAGMLVMGDAFASFNPSYGQGITVAAKQAQLLDTWLGGQMRGGARAFFRGAARIVDVPWSTIVSGDLQWPGVRGQRSFAASLLNGLFRRLVRASAHDHDTARALLAVLHLVAPPATLASPALLYRALVHGKEAAPRLLPDHNQVDQAMARPLGGAPARDVP
jgi:2-polyprenyl-6-methoxyphenol hydroxylase-like FAD-dependent oxidoreductase